MVLLKSQNWLKSNYFSIIKKIRCEADFFVIIYLNQSISFSNRSKKLVKDFPISMLKDLYKSINGERAILYSLFSSNSIAINSELPFSPIPIVLVRFFRIP